MLALGVWVEDRDYYASGFADIASKLACMVLDFAQISPLRCISYYMRDCYFVVARVIGKEKDIS